MLYPILSFAYSLVTLSRTSRRLAFESIFLLKNITYLRLHLLLHDPNLIEIHEDALNSNRLAKAEYFDSNFRPWCRPLQKVPQVGL